MNKLLIAGLIGVVALFFTADVAAQERGRREHRGQEHSEKAPIHKHKKQTAKRGAAKCGVNKCKCVCHKKAKSSPKKDAQRKNGRRGSRGRRGANPRRGNDAAPLWRRHLENLRRGEGRKTLPHRMYREQVIA